MRNVARLAEVPAWERKPITPWTVAESRAFLAAAADDPLYPALVCCWAWCSMPGWAGGGPTRPPGTCSSITRPARCGRSSPGSTDQDALVKGDVRPGTAVVPARTTVRQHV
jgi:hypothetical protein